VISTSPSSGTCSFMPGGEAWAWGGRRGRTRVLLWSIFYFFGHHVCFNPKIGLLEAGNVDLSIRLGIASQDRQLFCLPHPAVLQYNYTFLFLFLSIASASTLCPDIIFIFLTASGDILV
jgi:hypothetical protein